MLLRARDCMKGLSRVFLPDFNSGNRRSSMSDIAVVGYGRVSTDGQGERGAGLEAQRRAIRDEAERRGWRLIHIYEDVVSGRSMNGRHGLCAALDAVETGRASVLVVAKLDRLSRSSGELAQWIRAQRRRGATLQAICDRLNADGVPTANHGKLWRPTSLRTVLRTVEPRWVKVSPARGSTR